MDKVQNFVRKYGFIPSIDNRKIIIRSFEGRPLLHTALNAKLQADGSIVTKRAMVITDNNIHERDLNAEQIIFYHDEYAYESDKDCSEEVGNIMVDAMVKAGEYYNLLIPITGEYKIGRDWSIH